MLAKAKAMIDDGHIESDQLDRSLIIALQVRHLPPSPFWVCALVCRDLFR